MRQELLTDITRAFPLLKQLFGRDVALSVWDTTGTALYVLPAESALANLTPSMNNVSNTLSNLEKISNLNESKLDEIIASLND